MAAQNIGAGKWDRVGGITRVGIVANILLTTAMIVPVILFDCPVMAPFLVGPDSPAIEIARHIQLIASWNFVLFGVTMVLFATVCANGAALPDPARLRAAVSAGDRGGASRSTRP